MPHKYSDNRIIFDNFCTTTNHTAKKMLYSGIFFFVCIHCTKCTYTYICQTLTKLASQPSNRTIALRRRCRQQQQQQTTTT